MLQISADLLTMSNDAAVLIKNEKLAFVNAAAAKLLGSNCVGKSLREVFGEEFSQIQAGSFIGDFAIGEQHYIVRLRSADGVKALFLSPSDVPDNFISDAFIFSLRNCLMSIEVALDLLRSRGEDQPEILSCITDISHECYRINRIISNAGIIRSWQDNSLAIVKQHIDLSALAKNLASSIQSFFPDIEIRTNIPQGILIYADPVLIETLIMNLIANSIIHGKSCSRISLHLSAGTNSVFLSVDDNGEGISPDMLPSVFDRFRHSFDIGSLHLGSGLGLTVSRLIASLHGGTLLIESRPSLGTAVRVSFRQEEIPKAALKFDPHIHQPQMKNLLIGLAGCLPSEFFTEKYFD